MALPFLYTSPLTAVPQKPYPLQTRKAGLASEDRCAHSTATPLHSAEAAALSLEPCRGRRPPPSPRLGPQGSSCEKQTGKREKKVKERRRGTGEGGSESCIFPQAEQASPRRGPRPRSCLPSPGPPTRQQQHLSSTALQPRWGQPLILAWPLSSPCRSAVRGLRCTGTAPGPGTGFRWETPMVQGF